MTDIANAPTEVERLKAENERLRARVAELESQTHNQFKASFDRGVLQGLNEAAAIAQDEANGMRNGLGADMYSKAYANNVDAVEDAIEALIAQEGESHE